MGDASKQRVAEAHARQRERFLADGRPEAVLRERTALVDELVVAAHAATLAVAPGEGLVLLAVGGYGRRELFPHSDIDLLLLVRRPLDDPAAKAALAEFLRLLWDAGLRASQSVRTVEECCGVVEGNFELTVSLLDQRSLAGDPVLYGQFRERFARFLNAERRDLTRRLCRLARSRHAKFQHTIYRLEPDLKEHPGGLRDLQTVRWLAGLREAEPELDPRVVEYLCQVRCFLHYHAGRDSNLLAFAAQDELAAAPFSPVSDPQEWMQAYFRHARRMHRAALRELETAESQDRSLLSSFRDWRARLSNADFTVSRDRVLLRNPHELEVDARLAERLFLFLARHGIPPAVETERRLETLLPALRLKFGPPHSLAAFWKALFAQPRAVLALRAMQDCGLLAGVLPEWESIEHCVVRDFYHHYTIEEHTLVALETLERLAEAKDAPSARFAGLLEECTGEAWLLRVALLLHDTGKGGGGEHVEASLAVARPALARMGFDQDDAAMVLYLIGAHLELSQVMQSRDLGDPETGHYLAGRVGTIERLRLLTLLTFADVSAVNPSAMSPWRMDQLWRLYRAGSRALTGGLSTERIDAHEQALDAAPPAVQEFLAGLPRRYLLTHGPEHVETHAKLYQRSLAAGVAVEVTRRESVYQMTVVAPDRPFLFASLAGALASFGLNILKAEAFANQQGAIVDSFVFEDPHRTLELNPPETERLRQVVGRVAVGRQRVEELLEQRRGRGVPARSASISPAVTCDPASSSVATVFEVICEDRPGLLYHLASAISRAGCNIEVVLVDTEAHKAIDVFHVTSAGARLDEPACQALTAALLEACRR